MFLGSGRGFGLKVATGEGKESRPVGAGGVAAAVLMP